MKAVMRAFKALFIASLTTSCAAVALGSEAAPVEPVVAETPTPTVETDTLCEGTRKDDLYAGLGQQVSLTVKPDQYFVTYSESRELPFIPAAVHLSGQVLIREETCSLLQADPRGSEEALNALDLLAHEVAHAVDFLLGRELSDSAQYAHVNIGHADHVNHAERELFAFCMQRIAMGQDIRNRCPNSNYMVTTEVLRKVTGFSSSDLALNY